MKIPKTIRNYLSLLRFGVKDWRRYYNMFHQLWQQISPILLAQVMMYLIASIEQGSTEFLYFWIKVLALLFLIKIATSIFFGFITPEVTEKIAAKISRSNMEKLMTLEQNGVDRMGTGKLLTIFNSGGTAMTSALITLIPNVISESIGVVYTIVVILWQSQSLGYFWGFMAIAAVSLLLFWQGVKSVDRMRRKQKQLELERARVRARIFMTRMEILQTNSLEKENTKMDELYNEQARVKKT